MRFALPAFFVLAIANGLFADIAYAVAAGTGRLPFSPVIIIIILAAARLLMLGQPSGGPFPVLAMGVLAAGALVPSSRTITGMLTPTSLTAAMMPSAIMSQPSCCACRYCAAKVEFSRRHCAQVERAGAHSSFVTLVEVRPLAISAQMRSAKA